MSKVVVVGLQWGDEAKGKVVDFLAPGADYVVRFNGGNNAGHTVVHGEKIYKFHIVPVGVLNPGVTAVITDGVVVDPVVLVDEIEGLKAKGIDAGRIKLSGNAHVIMPWHKVLDQLEEQCKAGAKIGTTGRGIGPCYADKMSRTGIRIDELIDTERFKERLRGSLAQKNLIIERVYGGDPLDFDAIYEEYSAAAKVIAPLVCETSGILFDAAKSGANLLFEGAHGSLLDIDHGSYPFATSSHSVSGGACIGTGVGPTMIDRVIGIAKAYTTRVGSGACPTELEDEIGERIRERGKEYGTTTGRPRRCGWFDSVATRYSCRINGVTCVAVTLLDVLSGIDTLKICTHYEINGETVRDFPNYWARLDAAVPVYEEMPGWHEDLTGVTSYEQLPDNAKAYLKRLEELIEAPVCMASVGRRRDQSIVLDEKMLRM